MSVGARLWGQTMYEIVIAQDDDGRYYVEKSDIRGLHVEADSLDEIQAIILEMAPELIAANHHKSKVWEVLFGPRQAQPPRIKFTRDLCLA